MPTEKVQVKNRKRLNTYADEEQVLLAFTVYNSLKSPFSLERTGILSLSCNDRAISLPVEEHFGHIRGS